MASESPKRPRIALLVCLCLCIAAPALAQTEQGQLSGTVSDPTGARIAGAAIHAFNELTGEERSVQTDDRGAFRVFGLRAARYQVRAEAQGFTPTEIRGTAVAAGQEVSLAIILRPAGLSESVTVVNQLEHALDLSSARMGANVNQREVRDLPINGRQLSQLYLQAPGAQNGGTGVFNDIRFSGISSKHNMIRYDGIEGTGLIDPSPGDLNGEIPSAFRLQSSLENVQELRIESNNYPAEYGGEGGQINVVTRSGSNQFHGTLFEYARNEAFDAGNFFDLNKSKLRQHQFGGSIAGPVLKDRLFFFGNYESYRLDSGLNFIEAVPSLSLKARAVPAIVPLLDAFRSTKAVILPGASTNPDFDIAELQDNDGIRENFGSVRLDVRLNDRHRLYARYFRDQGGENAPEGVTGRRMRIGYAPQNAVVALDSVFSANTLNELKFGFNEATTRVNGLAPVVNGIDLSTITINISGNVVSRPVAGQGEAGIAQPGGLLRQSAATNGRAQPYTPYSISFIDSVSHTHGKHYLKAGGEVRLIRMWTDALGGTTYTYSNLDDFLANRTQQIQYLGDLSAPSPFNNGASGPRLLEQEFYAGYAQDEWRLKPNLTLNYGLRYDYYTTMREANNRAVFFDVDRGVLLPGSHPWYLSSKTSLQPRASLAWVPDRANHLVIRVGGGIYVGPGQAEDLIQPIQSDRITTAISGGAFPINPAVLVANFVNDPTNREYQPRAYPNDYRIPEKLYEYTVSVQQELPQGFVATLAYVGIQGRNLFTRNIANRIVSVRTNPDPTQDAIVIRQFDIVNGNTVLHPYAEIDTHASGGHSSYHALQASLGRRISTGLTLNAQYTLSRDTGNTSGADEAETAGNLTNPNYDNGRNSFNATHAFNLSAVYSLPFGRGHRFLSNASGVTQTVLGDWDLSAIVNVRSGLPIDVTVVRPDVVYLDAAGHVFDSPAPGRQAVINTPGGGASRNIRRPDVVQGVDPYIRNGSLVYLNPAAFAIPAPGKLGNLERNALVGPSFRQIDLALAKRFSFERWALEFRAEVFNVFNTANFSNPPAELPNALGIGSGQLQPGQPFTSPVAGNFGVLSDTVGKAVGLGTSRQMQFALRISF